MGSTVIQDECLHNLHLCLETMKDWQEMSEYDVLFEAMADKKVEAKVNTNAAVASKAKGYLDKAIAAIRDLIQKLRDNITDFIQRLTMKGDERKRFDEFRAACKEDPKLANKRITVKDFRALEKEHDQYIRMIDADIRELRKNEEHPIDKTVNKVKTFLSNPAKTALLTVGMDTAVKMAESNVKAAKGINALLKVEEATLGEISKTLGDKEASKYKKRVKAASKNTILTRLKIQLFRRQYDTMEDIVASTAQEIGRGDYLNPMKSKGRKFLGNENIKPVLKAGKYGAIGAAKGIVDYKKNEISKGIHSKIDKGANKSARDFLFGPKKDKEPKVKKVSDDEI